ncbi:MAG: hypothetical protein ACHBNF_14655 [Chromatiales bacterium]
MRLTGALVLAIALTWLTGCSNALYFYETEKIAMSLQGRPDSSQPVQGSLGLKQRVAIVAPPEDPDTMGEALSMISSFRFRKDPGTLRDIGPVTIQTAFVTGKAARSLDPPQAKQIARAIAQAQVVSEPISTDVEIADDIISRLKKPEREDDLERLKVLLKTTPCKELSPDQKKDYERLTDVARYRETLCDTVSKRLEAEP